MSLSIHNLLRLLIQTETGGLSLRVWHQVKSAENRHMTVLQSLSESMRLQSPDSLLGVDYNRILVWCQCPSLQTEYNQVNQGRVAEQSTAEEMKDAWVVVAIVHLIRTEVLIQSEQTQEVVLVKR